MALPLVSGALTQASCPNYIGPLFTVGAGSNVFLSLLGATTPEDGARYTTDVRVAIQYDEIPAAEDDGKLEGQEAPTLKGFQRAQVYNVCQIFMSAWGLTYSKAAATSQLAGIASTSGTNPIQNEMDYQTDRHLRKAANDINYSLINSTFLEPGDPTSTARSLRGILAALSTNVSAANGADFSRTLLENHLETMYTNGALRNLSEVFVLAGARQKRNISRAYAVEPADRYIGGVAIQKIVTDVGELNVAAIENHMPAGVIGIFDFSVMDLVFLQVIDPETGMNKGVLFVEPLAKTGATSKRQMYGEFTLQHGPEQLQGAITGMSNNFIT